MVLTNDSGCKVKERVFLDSRYTKRKMAMNRNRFSKFRRGINFRLLISIVAFSLVVIFVSAAIRLRHMYQDHINNITSQTEYIKKSYLPSLNNSLWMVDHEQVQIQLDGMLRLPYMQYVAVFTGDGKRFAFAGVSQSKNIIAQELPMSYVFIGQEINLGTLEVVASLEKVNKILWQNLSLTILEKGLEILILSAFILFIFHMLVTRHLLAMAAYTRQLNDFSQHKPLVLRRRVPEIQNRDEIDEVVSALNDTMTRLKQSYEELRESNTFLEKENAERIQAEEKLQEYQKAVEGSQDMITVLDQNYKYLLANNAFLKYTGMNREQVVGRAVEEVLGKDVFQRVVKKHLDSCSQGEVVQCEMKCTFSGFGERDLLVSYFPIESPDGVTRIANVVRDITERKQAEEMLRKSEHYFRSLLLNIHEDILVIDRDYKVTDVNNTLLVTVGLEREEVIGRHCYEILHDYKQPCSRYGEQCLLQAAFESGKPHNCRHIHTRMDTQSDRPKVWVDILLSPLKDEHGSVTHVIEAMRDITDLILTGEALRESEERHRTAIENSPDGVAIVQGGQPLFVNQKFVEIFGYDRPEEIIGKPLSTVLHTDDRNQFEEVSYERQKDGPVILRHEFKGIRKGGEPILIEVSATQINYRGEMASLVYLRDITERKRKEQEMASLQEQLRQSQKMEAIGLLAGGIAHDFGNLLAIIQGYSELSLLKLPKEDPLREDIEQVKNAGVRAKDLIGRLLAFSRRQIFQTSVLDLNTILRDLEKMLRRIIGEDIELVTLLASDLGKVEADPGQVEQILLNLAVNARDAMPSGGKLTIETTNTELDKTYARSHVAVKPGRYLMVSVSDTGIGMTPEVRERVFEPFFTTKDRGKGTGLGLSTVYGIVKQSGGNIWVYSEPGYGTTFKIYLPRVDEALQQAGEKKLLEEFPRGNETILVVEDEEKVLKLVLQILRVQGYRVLEAPRSGDALLICEQHESPIHLMVTDVVMPGMNGQELAKRLAPLRPEMKVLYMSAYPDNTVVHHGVLEKGVNFIQKPFTVAGLASKVRQVLDR